MKAVASMPGRVPQLPDREGFGAIWRIRCFLLLQIVILLSMVSIHFGLLIGGYGHRAAGTTEAVIAAVLVAGLLTLFDTGGVFIATIKSRQEDR